MAKKFMITFIFIIIATALLTGKVYLSLAENSSFTVNIKEHGALGNGKKDDKAAIEKAIKQLPEEGGTIYFPSGTYYISGTIDIPDNTALSGNATIKSTSNVLMFQVGDNTAFRNLTFYNCNTAIYGETRKNIVIDKCRFIKIKLAAVSFYGCSNSEVKNSNFYEIAKNSIVIDRQGSYINIHDNVFNNPEAYGGYTEAQISAHVYVLSGDRITVENNTVKNNGGQGIIFSFNSSTNKGTTNSVARGNICEGNGQEGITSFGGKLKVSRDNTIVSNTCKNNRFHQIECWESDNCTIENNTVDEFTTGGNLAAIMIYKSNYAKVLSNTILHARSNGIDIAHGSSYCTISGNVISNTNMSGNQLAHMGHGILLDSVDGPQPYSITIKDNKIASVNKAKTIEIKKSGVYSTSNQNHKNAIEGNDVQGYFYSVHPFATLTTGAIPLSTNASLSGISLEGIDYKPSFSSETVSYTAKVEHKVSKARMILYTADPNASVEVNGATAEKGKLHMIDLSVGENPIEITVTSEDKSFLNAYKIIITREPDTVADIEVPPDVKGHWAEKHITNLLKLNVAGGYPDGTMKPDNLITRAEAAKVAVNALGISPSDSSDLSFKDEIPDWVKGYLRSAVDKGIIKGYEDNTFRASNKITRKEMTVIIMRAFNLGESGTPAGFSDENKIPAWAKGYIARAAELGIVKGFEGNAFKPDGNSTRAEMFTILSRCLELKK